MTNTPVKRVFQKQLLLLRIWFCMALRCHYEIHQTTVISADQKQKLLNALLNCFTLLHLGILKHDFFCYLAKSMTMSTSWLLTSVKVRGVTSLQILRASRKTRLTLSLFICHGKRWILNTHGHSRTQSLSTKHTWSRLHTHIVLQTTSLSLLDHQPTQTHIRDHQWFIFIIHHHRHLSGEHVTWSHNVLWMVVLWA